MTTNSGENPDLAGLHVPSGDGVHVWPVETRVAALPSNLIGPADGPVKYIAALDMEVPTFINKRERLWGKGVTNVLMYHVPIPLRGPYREGNTKDGAWAMCQAHNIGNGRKCQRKAFNMSAFCAGHGGGCHPADKVMAPDPLTLTRKDAFLKGVLPAEDLDDEELAKAAIRNEDGTWFRMRHIPKNVYQRMVSELFNRADNVLERSLLSTVNTMVQISESDAYEPADRIKAATWIFERVRGKTPDRVIHAQEEPWKVTFERISGGSRADSRAARGYEDDEIVDAEPIDLSEATELEPYKGPPLPTQEDIEDLQAVEEAEEKRELISEYYAARPKTVGPAGKPMEGIPQNPNARAQYEAELKNEEERVAANLKDFKKKMREARGRREAAKARGFKTVEALPYRPMYRNIKNTPYIRLKWGEPFNLPVNMEALWQDAAVRKAKAARWRKQYGRAYDKKGN